MNTLLWNYLVACKMPFLLSFCFVWSFVFTMFMCLSILHMMMMMMWFLIKHFVPLSSSALSLPYSPDLMPCDFWFLQMMDEIKENTKERMTLQTVLKKRSNHEISLYSSECVWNINASRWAIFASTSVD